MESNRHVILLFSPKLPVSCLQPCRSSCHLFIFTPPITTLEAMDTVCIITWCCAHSRLKMWDKTNKLDFCCLFQLLDTDNWLCFSLLSCPLWMLLQLAPYLKRTWRMPGNPKSRLFYSETWLYFEWSYLSNPTKLDNLTKLSRKMS